MNTLRTYNVLRKNWLPLKEQYEGIKKYWKDKLIAEPCLLKEDRRYITFTVRV